MKLRTRIIWMNCILFLASSFITEVLVWCIIADNKRQAAYTKGYEEFEEFHRYITDHYNAEMQKNNFDSEIYLNYILKERNNDYDLCYKVETEKDGTKKYSEIHNNTIITVEQLTWYSYKNADDGAYYAEVSIRNRRYYIFKTGYAGINSSSNSSSNREKFEIYHLTDITYVNDELTQLAFIMVSVAAVVTVITIIILNIVLKREFRTLQNLSKSAEMIAAGEYHQRVDIVRKDEVGILGENFNRMAEAVEKRTENLKEAERKRTLFMGNLTHELKTPMTAISGYTQTLLSANLTEEETKEALLYIDKECKRIERMSQKMLKLLAIDSNIKMEWKDITAKELFDDVAVICSSILKNRNITLITREQGEHFWTDKDLMTDVLVNLVDNAIKASEQGQKIILSAKEDVIQVQDFGRGIPKEELENILEPFYMIDKSRSRKNGGAGLGLSLSALILNKNNVTLKIESEVGKGSRFILQFV